MPSNDFNFDSLIKVGLNDLFRGNHYSSDTTFDQLKSSAARHPRFSKEWFGLMEDQNQIYAMEYVSANDPLIYSDDPNWKTLVDRVTLGEVEASCSGWYGKSLVIEAAKLNPSYDWSVPFEAIVSESYSLGYISPAVSSIIECFSFYDKEAFYNYVFKKAKPHSWELRGRLYQSVVRNGTLTQKMARRIRSDSSAKASVRGVSTLLSNIELYSDYKNLIVQFVDTTYEDVAYELAKDIPEDMITYMMGTQFYPAKRKVERRVMEIEERKDALRAGNV